MPHVLQSIVFDLKIITKDSMILSFFELETGDQKCTSKNYIELIAFYFFLLVGNLLVFQSGRAGRDQGTNYDDVGMDISEVRFTNKVGLLQ